MSRTSGVKIGVSLLIMAFGGFALAQNTSPETKQKTEVATTKVATSRPESMGKADVADFSDSRFAFITDEKAAKVAIFDTTSVSEVGTLSLETAAELIGISKAKSQLFYAKRGESKIYGLNLKNQEKTHIAVDAPISDLAVLRDGYWLAYAHQAGTVVQSFADDAKKIKVATDGNVSLLFHPNGEFLFVAELSRGRLQRVRLDTQAVDTLFDLGKPMSPISVMPNGIALFFAADEQLQRYSLLDEARTSLNYKVATFRPYMTSDSRVILALTDAPKHELLVISAYTYKINLRLALSDWQLPAHHDDFLVTGWLEQFALIAGSRELNRLSLTESYIQADSQTEKVAYAQARDMFVQSDSKTVLLTQDNQLTLGVFDVRANVLKKSRLSLKQPNFIIMMESNTLCH